MALLMRLQHVWNRFTRPMTFGVQGCVLDGEDRVLLVRHSYVPGWHFPGGGVEAGETMLQSLARELREEGAIEMRGRPHLHGLFYNNRYSRRDHVAVFVVRDYETLGERKPDWEIVETGFFPVSDLPEGTARATRTRLREILAGEPPSDFWIEQAQSSDP